MNLSEKSTAPLTRLNGPMLMRVASGSAVAGLAGAIAGALPAPASVVGLVAVAALAAASAAACLLMSWRLMRPLSLMATRAKKSLSAPRSTRTCVAVAGASFTSRLRRFNVFQRSHSSASVWPLATVSARKFSSVVWPASCTLGPADAAA